MNNAERIKEMLRKACTAIYDVRDNGFGAKSLFEDVNFKNPYTDEFFVKNLRWREDETANALIEETKNDESISELRDVLVDAIDTIRHLTTRGMLCECAHCIYKVGSDACMGRESATECFKWKYDDFVKNMED